MKVTLVKHVRKDDNGNRELLDNMYMNEELLIDPEQGSALKLSNGTKFYINGIIQDLEAQRIICYEMDDICHREFWHDGFYEKYIAKLKSEGWSKEIPD